MDRVFVRATESVVKVVSVKNNFFLICGRKDQLCFINTQPPCFHQHPDKTFSNHSLQLLPSWKKKSPKLDQSPRNKTIHTDVSSHSLSSCFLLLWPNQLIYTKKKRKKITGMCLIFGWMVNVEICLINVQIWSCSQWRSITDRKWTNTGDVLLLFKFICLAYLFFNTKTDGGSCMVILYILITNISILKYVSTNF